VNKIDFQTFKISSAESKTTKSNYMYHSTCERTEIIRPSPTLGSRTAKEQNRTITSTTTTHRHVHGGSKLSSLKRRQITNWLTTAINKNI